MFSKIEDVAHYVLANQEALKVAKGPLKQSSEVQKSMIACATKYCFSPEDDLNHKCNIGDQ